ncbi:MAG: hypothetical protein M0C28_07380 [Candidatus Moduliflexus flocculans]|nr:hypothetical protein [Candidatus Moduliflexus flocculans]
MENCRLAVLADGHAGGEALGQGRHELDRGSGRDQLDGRAEARLVSRGTSFVARRPTTSGRAWRRISRTCSRRGRW